MRDIIEGPPEEGEKSPPLGKKLLWFVVLWIASAATIGAVAYALRFMLGLE